MRNCQMRSFWVRMGPKSDDTCPQKGRERTEAEAGLMRPQGQEHLQPPESSRCKKGLSPGDLGGRQHSPAGPWVSDFQPPEPGEITLPLLSATRLLLICHSSPGKRIQGPGSSKRQSGLKTSDWDKNHHTLHASDARRSCEKRGWPGSVRGTQGTKEAAQPPCGPARSRAEFLSDFSQQHSVRSQPAASPSPARMVSA